MLHTHEEPSHFFRCCCLAQKGGPKKTKQVVGDAMEGVGKTTIAGKTMSSMSEEKLADVHANLNKSLKKNMNKAVKQSVLEVRVITQMEICNAGSYVTSESYAHRWSTRRYVKMQRKRGWNL